jgi:aryl-alcohol dehydrogenase-like predicted oxidoreductase
MKYRNLGPSTLKTSVLGLGALHFGSLLNRNESIHIIHQALDQGVNFIDTAPIYGHGQSEEIIGEALQGRRQDVLIATKFGLSPETQRDGTFGVSGVPLTRKYIETSIDASLRALKTDYIDIYQIHYHDWITPREETFSSLHELVVKGKTRYIGCSNYNVQEIENTAPVATHKVPGKLVSAQCHYNMIERKAAHRLVPTCSRAGLAIMSNRPLARGLLSGRYRQDRPVPSGSRAESSPRIRRTLTPENMMVTSLLDAFAAQHGRTLAELSLAWVTQQPGVCLALVGVRDAGQLKSCLRGIQWSLKPETMLAIDRIIAEAGLEQTVHSAPEVFFEQ